MRARAATGAWLAASARRRTRVLGRYQALGRLAVCLCVGLLWAGPTGLARADASYEAVVAEGTAEFQAGGWIEAYTLFKHAYNLRPNARTLRGMGVASFELREYPRALTELQASLEHSEKPLSPEQRSSVLELVERTQRLVGTLVVTLIPADSTLFVNNRRHPAERKIVVGVGRTTLRAEHPQYGSTREEIVVEGGQHYPIAMDLRAHTAPSVAQAESSPAVADLRVPKVSNAGADSALNIRGTEYAGGADSGSTLWSSPWLWTGAGLAVVGAVVVVAVLLGGDLQTADANGGSTGLVLTVGP